MKKSLIIVSLILISAIAASAQTGARGELARLRPNSSGEKRSSATIKKSRVRGPAVLRLGPSTTYLKNGLKADEVVRLLGQPMALRERQDGSLRLATYTFTRGDGRVLVAEFENDSLVSSRMEASSDNTAQPSSDAGQ